jgi:hypothetical protein
MPPSVGDAPLAPCSRSGEVDIDPLVGEAREMASGPQSACKCRVARHSVLCSGPLRPWRPESEQLMIEVDVFSFFADQRMGMEGKK